MDSNKIHKHIRTERLDITEADGTLKLALFNSQSVAPLMMDGEDIMPGHRSGTGTAGIIFYNTEGDECGGLSLSSSKQDDGSYRSSLSMTFDQYKQDQVVQMFLQEENKNRQYGFRIFDRPEWNIRETVKMVKEIEATDDDEEKERIIDGIRKYSAVRMQMGKFLDNSVGIRINGKDGKERIRAYVDEKDNPHLELLDAEGNVVSKLV
jgi:hypothetical protein